jgi:hypothetical protein
MTKRAAICRKILSMRILWAASAMALQGCALTPDYVDLAYSSQTSADPVPGAAGGIVQVTTSEGRVSNLDKISAKKNGYGMEMAPIKANQPIQELVKGAVESELHKMGFQTNSSPTQVNVEINKFYSDFKIGFFSGNAVGEVTLNCQIRNSDQRILYSRTVSGEGDTGAIMLANGTNAKAAVEQALSAAVARLVSDPEFTRALLMATRSGNTVGS